METVSEEIEQLRNQPGGGKGSKTGCQTTQSYFLPLDRMLGWSRSFELGVLAFKKRGHTGWQCCGFSGHAGKGTFGRL